MNRKPGIGFVASFILQLPNESIMARKPYYLLMKVVILAGGFGTRLSEETISRPKPMVEIGRSPIIWHIMKIYSHYGFNDFIVCLGYKGYSIKEYFSNYMIHNSDIRVNTKNNSLDILNNHAEDWDITLIDTGESTMTGGRIKRVQKYVGSETFMVTYGDGVSNVDIAKLVAFHKMHGKLATVTAVQAPGRFGSLQMGDNNDRVNEFTEKPNDGRTWINGGFFVFEPGIFDYLEDDNTVLERGPLSKLAKDGQMMAFRHYGFWKPMDTLRDKQELEELWKSGKAPWKLWK